jgi:glycosyltransferase involved in cell wall biosynthesis
MKLPYCPIVQAHSEIWWPLDEELESFRASYRDALLPVFVSHSNRRLLEVQCGLRLERARVMFNPLNLRSREEVPWPGDSGPTHLACVGRLEPRAKGQDLLFQVLAQPKWRERPLFLNLFGKGGSEQSLRCLASQLQLESVRFHGHLSDLHRVWATNHALILPSRFEGLPLAIVEAMLCARPVLTTDIAGNAQLVRDGVNGFVAAAPAASLLDEALERAWQRRKDWRELGMQARRDALSAVPEDPVAEFARLILSLAGADLMGGPASGGVRNAVEESAGRIPA